MSVLEEIITKKFQEGLKNRIPESHGILMSDDSNWRRTSVIQVIES